MDTSETKKALVHVLGCKVNQAEGAAISGILEKEGFQLDPTAKNPDLVVVNTCCVTLKAEGKSRRAINRLKKQFPFARFVVTGCLAEVNRQAIFSLAPDAEILGTFEKDHFRDYLRNGFHKLEGSTALNCRSFGDLGFKTIPGRVRAFLKIQDGCSQMCSYCIVPTARGPSRSLEPGTVVSYAQKMALDFSEIVLTGIHLGNYGKDLNPPTNLEKLLERLIVKCSHVRFRLSSIEPQELSQHIIELVSQSSGLCRHFHLPLQSGDEQILRRMNRPYNIEYFIDLVQRIQEAIPDVCIGMDVMVGFPGEDDTSFGRTLALIEQLSPSYLHVFPFSPRPGTPAASFKPTVPEKISTKRVGRLRELSGKLRIQFYRKNIGKTFLVVPESKSDDTNMMVARTDNYIPVYIPVTPQFSGEKMFKVILTELKGNQVQGSLLA